jgi:hypothetical protein
LIKELQEAGWVLDRVTGRHHIFIEWGDDFTATGIQIPDIPGAVTAEDSFEEAYNAAV